VHASIDEADSMVGDVLQMLVVNIWDYDAVKVRSKIVCVGHSFALACEQDRLCNTRQEIFSQTSMIPFLISDMLKDVPWDYFVFLDLQIALF
jgi:hypothetical protein